MTSCLTMYHTPHLCNFFFFTGSETTRGIHRLSLLFITHLSDSSFALVQYTVSTRRQSALIVPYRLKYPPAPLFLPNYPTGPGISDRAALPLSLPIKFYRYAHGERESPRFSPCPMPHAPTATAPHTHTLSIHSAPGTPVVERLRPRQVRCVRASSSARANYLLACMQ